MIRLGSLAGYPFEGPRLLAGWTPPPVAAVYVITCKPDPERHPDRHAVIYVASADNLAAEGFPFQHPQAARWITRADSRWKLHVCWYEIPGDTPSHRAQLVRELIAIYRPKCNERQYVNSWNPSWLTP
jgi:hypothetical protein